MQLNRRALLGGVAASAIAAAADAQVMKGGNGRLLTSGGKALLKPPIPTPASGTLLSTNVTLTNPVGEPTHTSPYFSFGLPIPKGAFPASGYKLALYDSSGVTKITDLQVDQVCTGWSDGTVNYCVVSGYATGTTLAAGSSATFNIQAIPGAIPTTPVVTAATLIANSNIKAVCKQGSDTFTISFNNAVALFSGAPPDHPQGSVKQWKSGPVCGEWAFGMYPKRDSDGAVHKWAFVKIYVTALSPTGPFIMRGLLENTQSFTANPAGTIGGTPGSNNQTATQDVFDSIEFYNGNSFIGAMGGINDTRNGTFSPSDVNLSTGDIAVTWPTGSQPNYAPIGFASTGTLPNGLASSAPIESFWCVKGRAAGTMIPIANRWYACRIIEGSLPFVTSIVAGKNYALNTAIAVNGGYYAVIKAGVSTGLVPSGGTPGTQIADNSAGGTLVWALVSARVTSQGTGTHTVTLKSAVWRGSKAAAMGDDSYPFWGGVGALPKLLVGFDFNYLTAQTKAVPPFDPSITTAPFNGSQPVFIHNTVYLPGNTSFKDLGGTATSETDDRVCLFGATCGATIYRPDDRSMMISARYIALSFMDRQGYYHRDETSQQVIVCNYGPSRTGDSYPAMGASVPNKYLGWNSGGTVFQGFGGAVPAINTWPGYGGDFGSTNGSGDCSHMPNPIYWPYVISGDPLFLDALMEQSATIFSGGGYGQQVKTAILNGRRYSWVGDLFSQARGAGWKLRIFSSADWVIPDDHVARPYFNDMMDDSSVAFRLWAEQNLTALGQQVNFLPFVYPTQSPQTQTIETWMVTIFQLPMVLEAWKGNRPGWKTTLDYVCHQTMDLFDSDVGGSILIIDAAYSAVGSGVAPNHFLPPHDDQYLVSIKDRMQYAPGKAYDTQWPPAGPQFVRGLATAQSTCGSLYCYWKGVNPDPVGAAFAANTYGMMTRACCIIGAAAGIPIYQKLATRIQSVLDAQYGGNAAVWIKAGVGGNQNGLMYAVAIPAT